jgi:hypothetical protein
MIDEAKTISAPTIRRLTLLATCILVLFGAGRCVYGQSGTVGQAPTAAGTPERNNAQSTVLRVKVVPVSAAGIHESTSSGLGNAVTVAFDGLDRWSKDNHDPNSLRLFLGGRMLDDCKPILVNREQNYINFRLEMRPADRDKWVDIFTETIRTGKYDVPMSVGPKDSNEPFESSEKLHLQVYPEYTFWVVLLLIIMLFCLIWLGRSTDLLRDGPATEKKMRPTTPFSLGRVQMAWWFFLIIAAYLYIWLITGDYDTPNGSVLALMGISATTGLAAVVVDRNKATDAAGQRTALEVQEATLEARIAEITAGNPIPDSSLDKELQQKKSQVKEVHEKLLRLDPAPAAAVTRGFFGDLFQDGSGMSFHRFQIVVWTIVLGIVFVCSIYQKLAMPEFNAGLLGLLGISSGTYIGFKFPEPAK